MQVKGTQAGFQKILCRNRNFIVYNPKGL